MVNIATQCCLNQLACQAHLVYNQLQLDNPSGAASVKAQVYGLPHSHLPAGSTCESLMSHPCFPWTSSISTVSSCLWHAASRLLHFKGLPFLPAKPDLMAAGASNPALLDLVPISRVMNRPVVTLPPFPTVCGRSTADQPLDACALHSIREVIPCGGGCCC